MSDVWVPAAWVLDEVYARYRAGRMGVDEAVYLVRDAVDVTEFGALEMLDHPVAPSVRYAAPTAVTGHLDEATETWTDLDEMLAAELPPCEILDLRPWQPIDKPPCGKPSAKVIVLDCPRCGPRPRACCRKHLVAFRRRQALSRLLHFAFDVCLYCGSDLNIRGLS